MIGLYIFIGILIVLFIVMLFVANYMVSFSLDRTSKFNLETKAKKEGWQVKRPDMSDDQKWMHENAKIESIVTKDGLKLKGFYIPSKKKSNKSVLLIHGYGGIPEEMVPMARHYFSKGYSCLIPIHRSHGESEGRYISMGTFESRDMLLWLNILINKNPNTNILLHGVSMGGATVMMMCGLKLPENVKVAVEDCGYTNVNDIFSDKIRNLFHLPSFPLIPLSSAVCKVRAGFNFKEGDSLKSVKQTKIPLFFVHGTDDGFIPPKMMETLFNACNSPKEKLFIEGANHAESIKKNPKLYWEKIDSFIEKYM